MIEEWKKVPGKEYWINIDTPEGRCRRIYKNGKVKVLSNKPRKCDGRIYWVLSKDGKLTIQQAARWIAITYPELVQNEYFPGAEIDHIDTDRMNNHPSNLRWVTPKENCNNPLTRKHISEAAKGKKVIKLSLSNEKLQFYPSIREAERETGVKHTYISRCCRGKQKSAGGYKWSYL